MSRVTLTPKHALSVIAEEPSTHIATPTDLRQQAKAWDEDALRKERIGAGSRSKRRSATLRQESAQLRGHANVLRLAAEEVERRGAFNVGQAMENRVMRFFRQMRANPKRYRSAA